MKDFTFTLWGMIQNAIHFSIRLTLGCFFDLDG